MHSDENQARSSSKFGSVEFWKLLPDAELDRPRTAALILSFGLLLLQRECETHAHWPGSARAAAVAALARSEARRDALRQDGEKDAMYACCKEREEDDASGRESRREAMAQKEVQEEGRREGRARGASEKANGRRPNDWRGRMWTRPLLPRLAGLPLSLLLVVIWRIF